MAPLMSSTSRSKRQSGWLPVLIAVATGTGGTVTERVTLSEPVRQPPGQLAGVAEVVGVAVAGAVWLEVGRAGPDGLARSGPDDTGVVVAHEAVAVAASTVPAISAMSLSGVGARMGHLRGGARAVSLAPTV